MGNAAAPGGRATGRGRAPGKEVVVTGEGGTVTVGWEARRHLQGGVQVRAGCQLQAANSRLWIVTVSQVEGLVAWPVICQQLLEIVCTTCFHHSIHRKPSHVRTPGLRYK